MGIGLFSCWWILTFVALCEYEGLALRASQLIVDFVFLLIWNVAKLSSCHYNAEKLKVLEPCPQNILLTSSCQNNERNHLQEIEVRQPIG